MDKLSKIYLRNTHVKQTDVLGEELEKDTPIVTTLNVAKVEDTKTTKTTKTTKRPPSAYNIFMKATVTTLADTHKDLSAKARYTLALEMWREHKNK
jgi:hypothetical protein